MSSLRPLYALAIALLVVAFVGFGISAFYEEPRYPAFPAGIEEGPGVEMTSEEKRKMAEYRERERAYGEAYSDYNLVVACVSVGISVGGKVGIGGGVDVGGSGAAWQAASTRLSAVSETTSTLNLSLNQ